MWADPVPRPDQALVRVARRSGRRCPARTVRRGHRHRWRGGGSRRCCTAAAGSSAPRRLPAAAGPVSRPSARACAAPTPPGAHRRTSTGRPAGRSSCPSSSPTGSAGAHYSSGWRVMAWGSRPASSQPQIAVSNLEITEPGQWTRQTLRPGVAAVGPDGCRRPRSMAGRAAGTPRQTLVTEDETLLPAHRPHVLPRLPGLGVDPAPVRPFAGRWPHHAASRHCRGRIPV
jgi:hypothetical protein